MSTLLPLAAYSFAVVASAAVGACIPLLMRRRLGRIEILLAFSAGIMLGAAFFLMLPEAARTGGPEMLGWAAAGLLGLFVLERFVLVHVCEEPEEGCDVHGTMGLAAFFGLATHTVVDGIALGAATEVGMGAFVFVAIAAHKVPATLTLSSILSAERKSRLKVLGMSVAPALMVPVGAALSLAARHVLSADRFIPAAVAFSGGTFVHLALSDLLPDVHRRGGRRAVTIAALMAGVLAMWAVGRATGPGV